MALMHELDPTVNTGALSDESKGIAWGEIIRDYDPAADTKWRFGKPNYARVNAAYFKYRAKKHKEGSLESVVSKVVKNWEVESHHISDVNQWKTMDVSSFTVSVNGGQTANAQYMAEEGPYNLLLGETAMYSAKYNTFASSNTLWSSAFPNGFAWEVLDVLAGPPTVTFKWRHFGEFTGTFVDKDGTQHKGDGELINVIGLCIAKVTDSLQITHLDVYYNPDDLIKPLLKNPAHCGEERPIEPPEELSKPAPAAGCSKDACTVM